jgi:poly(3-hydroxybutyrate) depolymerase
VLLAILAAVVSIAAVIYARGRSASSSNASAAAESAGTAGILATKNSAGRSGAYFLPSGYEGRPLPVLVMLHGTASSGAASVMALHESAEKRKFIVIAPDSRIAPNGLASWQVPDKPGDTTDDYPHIRACVEEVRAMPGVVFDASRTLVAGHSGGASSAPYVASSDDFYGAFAVLHGGVFPSGLGPRRVRGWFSTGEQDPMRPPAGVAAARDAVDKMGFGPLEYRTYPEGHEVGPDELRELLDWWLGG